MSAIDPVRELMDRHRPLCEDAVHPLDIAAGLESAGLGPATSAPYRHTDVFTLAEELHARVPHTSSAPEPTLPRRRGRPLRAALALAAPCAGYVTARHFAAVPWVLPAVIAFGLLLLAAHSAYSTSPRKGGAGAVLMRGGAALGLAGLVGFRLVGAEAVNAPPEHTGIAGVRACAALAIALALAFGIAEYVARWSAGVGGGHLRASRSRAEFRRSMRLVLPVAAVLDLAALGALAFGLLILLDTAEGRPRIAAAVAAAGLPAWSALAATGLLLLQAALLRSGGRPRAAATALLTAAAATAAAAIAIAVLSRGLPPTLPSRAELYGCGAVAAALLPCTWRTLLRPEAHYHPL